MQKKILTLKQIKLQLKFKFLVLYFLTVCYFTRLKTERHLFYETLDRTTFVSKQKSRWLVPTSRANTSDSSAHSGDSGRVARSAFPWLEVVRLVVDLVHYFMVSLKKEDY